MANKKRNLKKEVTIPVMGKADMQFVRTEMNLLRKGKTNKKKNKKVNAILTKAKNCGAM